MSNQRYIRSDSEIAKIGVIGGAITLLFACRWGIDELVALLAHIPSETPAWKTVSLVALVILYPMWFYCGIIVLGAAIAVMLRTASLIALRQRFTLRWLKPLRMFVDWLITGRQKGTQGSA